MCTRKLKLKLENLKILMEQGLFGYRLGPFGYRLGNSLGTIGLLWAAMLAYLWVRSGSFFGYSYALFTVLCGLLGSSPIAPYTVRVPRGTRPV